MSFTPLKTLLKQLCYLSSAALLVSCASNPYTYTQSANYSHRVKFLVMHYTAIDYEKSMRALVDEGGLSSHYLLPESGDPSYPKDDLEIIQLVDEKDRAWHAGRSFWQGREDLNDHSIGIDIPLAAVALGSEILEKHITIDREMKGTDQAGSLGPDGIYRMVRDIRCLEMAMGEKMIVVDPTVESARIKLERSIASKRLIRKGEIIQLEDLHLLSPGDGYKWKQRDQLIGKVAVQDIPANEIIYKQ